MDIKALQHMQHLPDHKALCERLLQFFKNTPGITGMFLSGSGAKGGMDIYSDLDLGFVCESEAIREKIWSERFRWDLPGWFHRMDADHVKPYFIIYLFEPTIHVDLCFYTMASLPPQAGGPFVAVWDKPNQLGSWLKTANEPISNKPDWSNVVHEEERFWTWTHYCWCHVARGEYYDDASWAGWMRSVVEQWYARLSGRANIEMRRLEKRGEYEFVAKMRPAFYKPGRAESKEALLALISIHNEQRAQVEKLVNPKWTTTQSAREKITQLVREL